MYTNTVKKCTLKSVKTLSLIALLSTSSTLMASGNHSGGHGHNEGHNEGHNMSGMMGSESGHWMAPSAAAEQKNPIPSTEHSVAKGSQLYQSNCAACHGATAEGDGMAGMMLNPRPTDLVAMAGGHPDGDFAYKIREGRGAMPSWKNTLDEKQIWHLVNYIQTLGDNSNAKEAHGEHEHSDHHSHDS